MLRNRAGLGLAVINNPLRARQTAAIRRCFLAVAFFAWAGAVCAAQSSSTFTVRVGPPTPSVPGPGSGTDPNPGGGGNAGNGGSGGGLVNGLCRNTAGADAFGAHVTVVCATGALVDISPGRGGAPWVPMHGGAYRYVTQVFWNGDWIDNVDDRTGMGTTTSWRIVNLANRDYLELTVGW